MLISGQPDDPSPNCVNLTGSLTQFQVSGGSKVAAGPSTCGDWIVAMHHRTTSGPGQGVDGRLLCSGANNPGPDPPVRRTFHEWSRLRQKAVRARTHEFFQTT